MSVLQNIDELKSSFVGEIYTDNLMKTLYATDASVYREMPKAVAFPKVKNDIKLLIDFARENKIFLIPRTAGTSLAGQCVGDGIVVDVSKHFTAIIEVNSEDSWVKVQPGVIRDDLNRTLHKDDLYFAPETSTANRAMIGGMVGNNSSGANSIVYKTTRENLLEIEAFLSDGSLVTFSDLSVEEFQQKRQQQDLEGTIYNQIWETLSQKEVQKEIATHFPKKNIHRRNTGYAIDELLQAEVFGAKGSFNFCKLIAGSEGTLAFITAIKLKCVSLPPAHSLMVCPHFETVGEALLAVQTAMEQNPSACELMDKIIMDCTKENREYAQYRDFVKGNPAALLMIDFRGKSLEVVKQKADSLIQLFQDKNLGYHYPVLSKNEAQKAWKLRKAGLGLLANIKGDKKAVAVIEDTAVSLEDLPDYIADFTAMMKGFGQEAVYYAHAGAGEIHLRPILNLKESEDVKLFEEIALATAKLVKKYKGSLSGEHGDGRVRASFLPMMIGEKNYALLQEIKQTWDADNIFNQGKIIDAKPITEDLRYETDRKEPQLKTLMDFSDTDGFLRMTEKCNGSGDCRKTALSGGTMCPSYMATKNEKDTTRGRANVLREFLTQNDNEREKWTAPEIKEALDLCLSCKGCKSECPSNVDMAALKAEYLYQNHKINGTPLRNKLFGSVERLNRLGILMPSVTNWLNNTALMKRVMGIAPKREVPHLAKQTLKSWFSKRQKIQVEKSVISEVYLFADEFTNYYDVEIGKKAILLLEKLGYSVKIAAINDSGRAYISKGMLQEAQQLAMENIGKIKDIVSEKTPLIGIEPSAILSFRDEYERLAPNQGLKSNTVLLIDEFLANEVDKGNIKSTSFTEGFQQIKLHGHCHQKALSKLSCTEKILSLPKNYFVETLPTGCCGMAGSFGYEKEHYDVSMQVGELVLFPAVRKMESKEIICAVGTSCRHQIKDGTKIESLHPVEIIYDALK